jgi:hypothetical protein
MKKIIFFGLAVLVLISSAGAFEVNIYNDDMEESYLFSPGDRMIVQAAAEADAADFQLLYNNMDNILNAEMSKIEENKFEFNYIIPEDIGKGNYLIKITANNSEEFREIVIGNVIAMQFIDPENEEFQELEAKKDRLKARAERKDYSLIQKLAMIAKNVWVNYIWIGE